jgi:uncharacterized alkaline shock family protein YloU
MTESDRRTGSEGVKDNVWDGLAEAAGSRKEAAPEEEEQAGSGGVKNTVRVRKLSGGERGAKERIRMSAQTTDNGRQHQQSPLKTERGGTTTIQDSVVSKVAGIAAQEVEGIRMGSSTTQTVGSLMSAVPGVGSQSESRGVSVGVGEVEAAVDLSMSVEYGRIIHQIAESVRTNVIRRVEHLVGLRVTEVNITVSDIFFPQQEQHQEQ